MTYTTIQGDTWDLISHKVYGNAIYANRIMESNPSHGMTVIFSAGTILTIPAAPAAVSNDLPPWKRGGV